MKQEDKHQWVESVINSVKDLPPAEPGRDLFPGIEQRIKIVTLRGRVVPLRTVSAVAAALLVLLAFNYFTVSHKKLPGKAPSGTQEIIQFYQLNDDDVLSGY
ncbi:hypothetical protein ACTHGU_15350 [Chitinophagaceae bacterium MMS25-I14]